MLKQTGLTIFCWIVHGPVLNVKTDWTHNFLLDSMQACVKRENRLDSPNHFLLGSTRACVPEGRVDWKTAGRMIFPVAFLQHTHTHTHTHTMTTIIA